VNQDKRSSDDASHYRHWLYGARRLRHTILVHHYSQFEIRIPFTVHPELGHHGYRSDQYRGACLPDPETSGPSAMVSHHRDLRQRPVFICDCLFHTGLPFSRICFPHVTGTMLSSFLGVCSLVA
jgi:hypothetical protein